MILGDFHIHSRNSDGRLSISELVDFYGTRGFGVIAITDHLCEQKTLLGQSARYLQKTLLNKNFHRYLVEIGIESIRAMRRYNMVVIPGVEFTKNSFSHSRSAHFLGLGISQFIDPDLSCAEIINQIHAQGGIAVAAHPVPTRKVEPQTFHLWDNRDKFSQLFDAWEVASGSHLFTEVKESGLPMLANSDLHHPIQISSWKTLIDGARKPKEILTAIKNQNIDFTYYEDTEASSKSKWDLSG